MFSFDTLAAYINFWCEGLDKEPPFSVGFVKVTFLDKYFDVSVSRTFYFRDVKSLDKAISYLKRNKVEFSYVYHC